MSYTQYSKYIYRIFLTIGLIVHVSIITIGYLRYETRTSLNLSLPTTTHSQALSVCFKLIELLDQDWVEKKYGHRLTHGKLVDREKSADQLQRDITMREIFDRTPSVDEAYGMVYIRDNDTYGVELVRDRKSMTKYFEIYRYITQDYICYRVQTRDRLVYNYEIMAKSRWMGMVYAFGFSREIATRASFLMPVIHGANDIPMSSILYSPQSDFSMSENLSVFRVVSQKIAKQYLPHPYETDCFDYKGKDRERLMNECLVLMTINRLGFIPFSEIKSLPLFPNYGHLKIKHQSDFATNRTLWSQMKQIKSHCDRLYPKVECKTSFFTTFIVGRHNWGDGLVFRVGQPTSPTIVVTYHPNQDFYTFFLFTLSCFGVWLGWSLMDFDPSTLVERFRTRSRQSTATIGSRKVSYVKVKVIKRNIVRHPMYH